MTTRLVDVDDLAAGIHAAVQHRGHDYRDPHLCSPSCGEQARFVASLVWDSLPGRPAAGLDQRVDRRNELVRTFPDAGVAMIRLTGDRMELVDPASAVRITVRNRDDAPIVELSLFVGTTDGYTPVDLAAGDWILRRPDDDDLVGAYNPPVAPQPEGAL